jgi:hypothetical protein
VQFADFVILADNFDQVAAASVPEPAVGVAGLLSMLIVLGSAGRVKCESAETRSPVHTEDRAETAPCPDRGSPPGRK